MHTVAGILTGGASRRMGQPKALLRANGITILERTVDAAARITDNVILLGRPIFDLPASLAHLRILEDQRGGAGPIAGLATALHCLPNTAILLLACDMPNITSDLLSRLTPTGREDAAIFSTGHPPRRHSCCALYAPQCAAIVEQQIAAHSYRMMDLLDKLHLRVIELDEADSRLVHNINMPADVPFSPPAETEQTNQS